MKILIRLIALAIHVAIIVTIVQNWNTPVDVTFGQLHYAGLSLGYLVLKTYILGLVAMGAEFLMAYRRTASQMKQWELRREKAEVAAETQTDQVQALQSKINTLEKALESALAQRKDA